MTRSSLLKTFVLFIGVLGLIFLLLDIIIVSFIFLALMFSETLIEIFYRKVIHGGKNNV